MTYAEAMEIRDRVRARQPVDEQDVLEAQRVVSRARGLSALELVPVVPTEEPRRESPVMTWEGLTRTISAPPRSDVILTVQRGQVWEVATRLDRYEAEVLGEWIEHYGRAAPGRIWVRQLSHHKVTPLQALLSMFTDRTGGYKYIRG